MERRTHWTDRQFFLRNINFAILKLKPFMHKRDLFWNPKDAKIDYELFLCYTVKDAAKLAASMK